MTGPEHYQLAEIAQEAAAAMQGERLSYTPAEALLDALAHAVLAQTAMSAMAEGVRIGAVSVARVEQWLRVIGVYETGTPDEATP